MAAVAVRIPQLVTVEDVLSHLLTLALRKYGKIQLNRRVVLERVRVQFRLGLSPDSTRLLGQDPRDHFFPLRFG